MFLEKIKSFNLVKEKSPEDFKQGEIFLKAYNNTLCMGKVISANSDIMQMENIIDLNASSLIAEKGFLKILGKDNYFEISTDFSFEECQEALSIIQSSALYTMNSVHRNDILSFTASLFPPKFIIFLRKHNLMSILFIPVQQKLRIGKYAGIDKWEDLNISRFKNSLDKLSQNEYITYMACLPEGKMNKALFYTSGTETHVETDKKLKNEVPECLTNCGGNIKFFKQDGETKYYIVDAGSNFKGRGVQATLEEALSVSVYLKKMYPGYKFIPAHGRGGVGSKSSF